MQRKKLKELNLLDDFLFNAMMTHPEVGEKFTHRILECVFEKEFPKLKVIPQRTYGGMDTDLRGARLDVYEDGARTMVLYTKGTKGEVSEKLSQLLRYMEHTTWENAVNDALKEIQEMVEIVKRDQEVTVGYMKWFERDRMLREESLEEGRAEGREEGRAEERKNTEAAERKMEAQRQRADEEHRRANEAEKNREAEHQRANEAERKIAELEAELRKYQEQARSVLYPEAIVTITKKSEKNTGINLK